MSPEQWLANFESKIADLQAKTAEFRENLEAAGASAASADGSIRVTVAPNGSLTDLHLADSVLKGSGSALAAEIMKLARKAQRGAAVNVAEAFAPLGADSPAMRMVTGYLPPEEPEEPKPEQPTYRFVNETSSAEPPAPTPRPNRVRRPPTEDDDEYFDGESFLR